MILLQLFLFCIWLSVCHSQGPCHSQCKCEGISLDSFLDCSGKSWIYFPEISEIPSTVGTIILRNNNIGQFHPRGAATGHRPNVWSIDISENKIINAEENGLHEMFPNLIFLDLSKNQIQQIKQQAFSGLKLLRNLHLERNQIRLITNNAFDNLANLAELNLGNNQLMILNFRWLRNLKSLTSLHLADNRIAKVESWRHPWPSSLKNVFLNGNKIPFLLPMPKHVQMFRLDGNPTHCECRPEILNLNNILNQTLCNIQMQCKSTKLKYDCKHKNLSEEVHRFLKSIATAPICQVPVVKELSIVKNHEKVPYITCVGIGVPAPNVTLFSNDRKQKLQVSGVEKANLTQGTIHQLNSGIYRCKVSNNLGEVTRKLVVDLNEDCHTTCSNSNVTSEVPFLHERKKGKFKTTYFIVIIMKPRKFSKNSYTFVICLQNILKARQEAYYS